MVEAVDRVRGVGIDGRSRRATLIRVGERADGRAVAALSRSERDREGGPSRRGVEPAQQCGVELGRSGLLAPSGCERPGPQPVEQRDERDGRVAAGPPSAARHTGGEERIEGVLERTGLVDLELLHGTRGIDGTVERGGAHMGGEQIGVGRAEQGPVRQAEVRQALVAEAPPELVEVAGHVGGADVWQQRPGRTRTCLRVLGVGTHDGIDRTGCRRGRIGAEADTTRAVARARAVDGAAAPDASRVQLDHVEALAHARRQQAEVASDERVPRLAGSTGVHHQGTDALGRIGRPAADHRHPGRGSAWLRVVEGNREGRALERAAPHPGQGRSGRQRCRRRRGDERGRGRRGP